MAAQKMLHFIFLSDKEDDDELTLEIRKLEIEAVKNAEDGKLEEALTILQNAILLNPKRASSYNNRAQVYQLQKKTEGTLPHN